jgi:tRNA U34 5-methylaminomethyl-2-thiouridine-forming methyltransferase MnmC
VEIKQVITADGSPTLFLPGMDEHYHSTNGAIQESRHVYINSAFNRCFLDSISVLEMGFGTGLNAFLTALESEKRKVKVNYTTLEKYPLPSEIIKTLNYSDEKGDLFRKIHSSEWEKPTEITPFFLLNKIQIDFNDFDFSGQYDVVYYDAFAPDKQAEVWSQGLFNKLYSSMKWGGILTTYCAKGNIRRMMQQAGFMVERIPGPPGKREMLNAIKDNSNSQTPTYTNV